MPASRITIRIALVLSVALAAASGAISADLGPYPDPAPAPGLASRPELPRGFGIDHMVERMCETGAVEVEVYPPAPRYVYDNRRGPTWTGNGWVYLPIGEYPDEYAPRLVAPPPPHGVNPADFLKVPCSILKHLPEYLPGR